MRIIEREHIDIERWNELVRNTPKATVFIESAYLDAVAENWCLLTDDDYSCGMPLPYSIRAGQRILYTPLFIRMVQTINFSIESQLPLLKSWFKTVELAIDRKVDGFAHGNGVYQVLLPNEEQVLHGQALRMFRKAEKNHFEINLGSDFTVVIEVIRQELEGRIQGINSKSTIALHRLMDAYRQQNRLRVFQLGDYGGLVCIENEHTLLYLKGAVKSDARQQGGMYVLMQAAISYARKKGLIFDFGGSRVEGVRRFNRNLGGKDCVYYTLIREDGPLWFRLAKKCKRKWIKK